MNKQHLTVCLEVMNQETSHQPLCFPGVPRLIKTFQVSGQVYQDVAAAGDLPSTSPIVLEPIRPVTAADKPLSLRHNVDII